jgi:hypothetical protein
MRKVRGNGTDHKHRPDIQYSGSVIVGEGKRVAADVKQLRRRRQKRGQLGYQQP